MRVTPAGSRTLRLQVDCGEEGSQLVLQVVMVGDAAAELARKLRIGERLHAVGGLRALPNGSGYRARLGIEIVASQITQELTGVKL